MIMANIFQKPTKKVKEEHQKRLGPGGLDPVEVNIPKLQQVLSAMSKEDATYHMKRCVDSGLWVADAKSAGHTPASEELKKHQDQEEEEEDEEGESSDEHYEDVNDDLGLD